MEKIAPLFGRAIGHVDHNNAYVEVRDDLFPRIQNFVIKHELYHLTDRWQWWGVFGREIRANIVPGITDPLGLILSVFITLITPERVALYIDRIRKRH